ncbi:MAG: hypothetical protein KGS61_17575, partial [Verrucomicrobia bacterium]|nr:hypothetical protein [Verrucomicrobiota bacterium]
MWKVIAQLVLGLLLAAQDLSAAATVRAEDAPVAAKSGKSAAKGKHTRFRGTLKAVDNQVALTFVVSGKDGDRTFQ